MGPCTAYSKSSAEEDAMVATSDDDMATMVTAASFHVDFGWTQDRIAQEMHVSPAKVFQWMQLMKKTGVIATTIKEEGIDDRILQNVGYRQCQTCLENYLKKHDPHGHIKHVKIFPSEASESDPDPWAKRISAHAKLAGQYVAKILSEPKERKSDFIIGLAWGTTVSKTVETIRQLPSWKEWSSRKRLCVATTGELTGLKKPGSELSSSYLAEQLAFSGKNCESITLRGIPAMIAPTVSDDLGERIKEYFAETYVNYQLLFSGEQAMANRMNAIITSLGNMNQPNKLWKEYLIKGGLEPKLLDDVEDIGGVLLYDPSLSTKEKEIIKLLENRWLGIKMEHYLACAEKAKPGVIVIAIGENKANAVLKAVEHGLVTMLIIDQELAQSLGYKLIERERKRLGQWRQDPAPEKYCSERFPALKCALFKLKLAPSTPSKRARLNKRAKKSMSAQK
jgi:DNA-binding transcriptional regulator LsrR (DeoR family)